MKSFVISLLVVLAFTVTAVLANANGKNFTATGTSNVSAANVVVYAINSGLSDTTIDSIDNGKSVTYGPYALCIEHSRGMFKTFQMHYPTGTVGAADTALISYQLLPTFNTNDTSATWNALDTIQNTNAGKFGNSTDISAKIALSIIFRVTAVDVKGGIRIKKKIRALFLENFITHANK